VKEHHLLDDASRPGDLTIRNWHQCQGRHTAFNVVVTSPLQRNSLERSAADPSHALIHAANLKNGVQHVRLNSSPSSHFRSPHLGRGTPTLLTIFETLHGFRPQDQALIKDVPSNFFLTTFNLPAA
jgi:hypothetical protein